MICHHESGIFTNNKMQFILASASPRRKELLSYILTNFEVVPSNTEEEVNLSLFPEQMACALAECKCDEVFKANRQKTVIGCDTVVVFGGEVLGKPKDREDAVQTLKKLSGKTHYVITGVCVQNRFKKVVNYEETEVKFNVLTDEFIEKYVSGGSPMDKAGSYGIQDEGVVKEYFGSFTNVVGLPVTLTKKMIEEVLEDL